jgi:hypothetical protein
MFKNPLQQDEKIIKVSFRTKKKTKEQPANQFTIDYYKGKAEALMEVIKVITDKELL